MEVVEVERVLLILKGIGISQKLEETIKMMLGTQSFDLEEHDKQIIKEFVNEVDKYICTHHAKCEDCDFTYKTCFECFYHTECLKENK